MVLCWEVWEGKSHKFLERIVCMWQYFNYWLYFFPHSRALENFSLQRFYSAVFDNLIIHRGKIYFSGDSKKVVAKIPYQLFNTFIQFHLQHFYYTFHIHVEKIVKKEETWQKISKIVKCVLNKLKWIQNEQICCGIFGGLCGGNWGVSN